MKNVLGVYFCLTWLYSENVCVRPENNLLTAAARTERNADGTAPPVPKYRTDFFFGGGVDDPAD